MKLSRFCEIQLGYTARGRLEPTEADGVRAIQLRDLTSDGGHGDGVGQYRLEAVAERYWVTERDVLFRSRGDRNTATALSGWIKNPAVAIMPLVILRPKQMLDSRYLTWFINQPLAQRHFDSCAYGTNIRMIPVGCLADLEVPLPDLKTQKLIAEVDELAAREHQLATHLATKRWQVINFALLKQARDLSPTGGGK